jgi:hypothetical protein
VKDAAFTALSISQKKAMVRHLQCLRLLLWLLRKENYMTITSCKDPQSSPSRLAREAAVHSLAAFCTSYSVLDLALGHRSLQLESVLPWLRWKPWLQYLFDRAEDRTEDGERIMSMVVQQWERMPPPEYDAPGYYITVPQERPRPSKHKSRSAEKPRMQRNRVIFFCCARTVLKKVSAESSSYRYRSHHAASEGLSAKLSTGRYWHELFRTQQQNSEERTCHLCNHEIGQERFWGKS